MKFAVAIALFATIAVASAAFLPGAPGQSAPGADASAETLKNESNVGTDSYQFAYETSNQIKAQEQGQLKQIGSESGIASQGSFSFVAPDGQTYTVSYVADENGFQPQGAHIPVAPVA